MTGRLPIAVDRDYTSALGLAVYTFALLEWTAVRCCERIEAGSIAALDDRTAGRVADTLAALVARIPASPEQAELARAAAKFQGLVRSRNNLVHARPDTDFDGAQRLFRDGDPWSISEIEGIADAFALCGNRLSAVLNARDGPLT